MYKMYFDKVTYDKYDGSEKSEFDLVYMSGSDSDKYRITAPKYAHDLGCAGELTFTMLPNDNLWRNEVSDQDFAAESRYTKITTYVYLYRNSKCFWKGRVTEDSTDFYGNRIVTCEGQLAFLNDVNALRYSYGYGVYPDYHGDYRHSVDRISPSSLLDMFIGMYNESVPTTKQIQIGEAQFMQPHIGLQVESDEFASVLDALLTEFSSGGVNDGYFSFHYDDAKDSNGDVKEIHSYLDYHKYNDMTIRSNQSLQFGENIVDIAQHIDGSDIFTAIVPLGAYTTNHTCKSCNTVVNVHNDRVKNSVLWAHLQTHGNSITGGATSPNEDIINEWFDKSEQGPRLTIESVYSVNGIKRCVYPYPSSLTFRNDALINTYGWIERAVVFEDIDDPIKLLEAGIAYRSLINMVDTIEVRAYDLRNAGYNVDGIELGDMVQVTSSPHSIYKFLQCIRIELELDNPDNDVYVFGTKLSGFTDRQLDAAKASDRNKKAISYLTMRLHEANL